jgi:hypothetical protein
MAVMTAMAGQTAMAGHLQVWPSYFNMHIWPRPLAVAGQIFWPASGQLAVKIFEAGHQPYSTVHL